MNELLDPATLDAMLGALRSHAWPLLAALAILTVVRLLKADVGWTPTVPVRFRRAFAFALGLAAGASEAVIQGRPLDEALLRGAFAAVLAMAAHSVVVERLRGGREIGAPARSAVPAGYPAEPPAAEALPEGAVRAHSTPPPEPRA